MLLVFMCVITQSFPLHNPASSLLSIPFASHCSIRHPSSYLPKFCSSQTLLNSP